MTNYTPYLLGLLLVPLIFFFCYFLLYAHLFFLFFFVLYTSTKLIYPSIFSAILQCSFNSTLVFSFFFLSILLNMSCNSLTVFQPGKHNLEKKGEKRYNEAKLYFCSPISVPYVNQSFYVNQTSGIWR